MAKDNQSKGSVPVYGFEDGFLAVKQVEDAYLDQYLQVYAARIDGYKIEPGERACNVTMKIAFPTCDNEANASMWAWFIVKVAHPTATKPQTRVMRDEHGIVVYASWPIWNTVKFMESKRKGFEGF